MESAERVTEPGEIEVRSAGLEVLARGGNDPEPKMISRIPDHARKPRQRIEFPPNLSLGNLLPPSWR
jgi:hypothetical protein